MLALKICSFFVILITAPLSAFSQDVPAIAEADKRLVFRIETPEGFGTGFTVIDDSLRVVLVTNKHCLRSKKNGKFFDSVFVRTNSPLNGGKVVTTGERAVLQLNYRGGPLFETHPDPNVDIAIVACMVPSLDGGSFINPIFKTNFAYGVPTSHVASRNDFEQLNIRDGTNVQIIGFSFEAFQLPQFHISRFGKIALHSREKIALPFVEETDTTLINSEWLLLDISSRGGDSGGPAFAFLPGLDYPLLIGIVMGGSDFDEICLAFPSYYILDLIESVKSRLKR